ncbi:MAG: hypothetical protein EOP22_19325 [Hyphomicrobiales bacterium]|nr:MAG: hypothetical protein EOP22_19325 [Hyphomicrobiales bacterium]
MARAYQQSQPADYDDNRSPAEWQSLRSELAALLDQVDGQVAKSRGESPLTERLRDIRHQVEEVDERGGTRHRDALRTVQRQISRFEEPAPQPQLPPNPRDSLQSAINQIRSRQGEPMRQPMAAAPQPQPARANDGPMLAHLATSVNGLSGRLERLEGEIRAQIKSGAGVKDVADQVAQLAHVVELLAGAVGETGQVKRLEGQIASLGKIMSQGREMDINTLTRRLDDVAATVGKLAELQVHTADRMQTPLQSEAFADGMRTIEDSVRSVYDRIDALERQRSLSPSDLDHVTAEMARFTEGLRENQQQPLNLIELVDALNMRIADIESGDKMLDGLRGDLDALRETLTGTLAPRFEALEQRLDTLSSEVGTRADMAEIGRQIGMLGDRMGERSDPGISQLEAQVRQLVARMDQTGEQLTGLSHLYSETSAAPAIDFDAMADLVATRTAEAVQRSSSNGLTETINALEGRITEMLRAMPQNNNNDSGDFDEMQAGISEVNDRLKRLEVSLTHRLASAASEPAAEMVPQAAIADIIAEAEASYTPMAPLVARDVMPRSPAEDAPLNAPAFPAPEPEPVFEPAPRLRQPGLDGTESLASLYDSKPAAPMPAMGFEPLISSMPAAPMPSAGFIDAPASEPVARLEPAEAPVAASSRNTFIEAARRAAQRQNSGAVTPVASNSLIGKALSRFQAEAKADQPKVAKPLKPAKAMKGAKAEPAPRALAGDKPARAAFAAEATPEIASLEAQVKDEAPQDDAAPKESFLLRNRKTILLAAAVVALAMLTLNLVAQRLQDADTVPAAAAPITTGDIADELPVAAQPLAEMDVASTSAPRVIDMQDTLSTGAINPNAAQGFTTAPLQTMPSAFGAATELAKTDTIAPLAPEASPVSFEQPPEGVGPLDLRDAAANGDARAQFEVAAILTEGRALPQDYATAAIWYERAAATGFVPAQYRLASLYENGNGVEKNLDAAKLWYERAAEAGNRMSMHNLAALYAGGQLGKQQFDAAAKWFEEAATRGMTDSQFNLGMLYARGLGVPQDLESSFKWFGIAALSGDKDAQKARDDVARSLDAETMTRLTDIINNFKPTTIDLAANFAPIGTWSTTFDPGETIGARDIVASVQKALGKLGYDVGTPDGIAGAKTATAIKAFEMATGMSAVGQINPRLLAVLGSQPV